MASLGSLGGTRRVSTRTRTTDLLSEGLSGSGIGGSSSTHSSAAGGSTTTSWMHPDEVAAMRRRDRQRREAEAERMRDEAAARAQAATGIAMAASAHGQHHTRSSSSSSHSRADSFSSPGGSAAAASAAASGSLSDRSTFSSRSRTHSRHLTSPLSPSSSAAAAAAAFPALLARSYALGSLRTLNGKLGLIVYLGPVHPLQGTWIALRMYTPHGLSARWPVFDFATLRHRRQDSPGGLLQPVEPAHLAETSRRRLMGERSSMQIAAADAARLHAAAVAEAYAHAQGSKGVVLPPPLVEIHSPRSSPLASSSSASSPAALPPLIGLGSDNYAEMSWPLTGGVPEVDLATLVRAQREASKMLGPGVPGECTVFVRVAEREERPNTQQQRDASTPSAGAIPSGSLLPVLTTPRTLKPAALSSSAARKVGGSVATEPQSPLSPLSPPIAGSSTTERRRPRVQQQSQSECKESEQPTDVNSSADSSSTASSKPAQNAVDRAAKTEEPKQPHYVASITAKSAVALAKSSSSASVSSVASLSSAPLATALPLDPHDLVVDSEAALALVARRLHLTGPFAEVDAIALTAPRTASASLYSLARYLTGYFPGVIQGGAATTTQQGAGVASQHELERGSSEERKVRVLCRWVADHVAMLRSPLEERVRPGDKLQKEADSGATAARPATSGPLTIDPSAAASSVVADDLSPSASPAAASVSQPSLGSFALRDKVAKFHAMDLGMGPSARHGGRMKHARSRGRRDHAGGSSGSQDHAAMSDSVFSMFGSSSFGFGGGSGYSSEEADVDLSAAPSNAASTADGQEDEAVAAVVKKSGLHARAASSLGPVDGANSLAAAAAAVEIDPAAPLTADSVLSARISTSYGFSILFQALCACAGIECIVVRGLVKFGPEYRRRYTRLSRVQQGGRGVEIKSHTNRAKSSDHSDPTVAYSDWNLVRINGAWQIVDCFLCAGYWHVDDDASGCGTGCFRKCFSSAYFTPAPETFILNHYPLFVYRHTGVEHFANQQEADGMGAAAGRKYRTVLGLDAQGAPMVLARLDAAGGYTAKDPSQMTVPEFLAHPQSLQLLQPPVTVAAFFDFVSISRSYAESFIETYESDYEIVYGVNALAGGLLGATFQIELEVPLWLEVGAELCKLAPQAPSASGEQDRMSIKIERAASTVNSPPAVESMSSASPASAQSMSLPAASPRHRKAPSLASSFVSQLGDAGSADLAALLPPSILSQEGAASIAAQLHAKSLSDQASFRVSAAAAAQVIDIDERDEIADLSTCWAAQKAVGTRVEIRHGGAAAAGGASSLLSINPATSGANAAPLMLQRQKRVHLRTRMKIHLVFPYAGKYRLILYDKKPELEARSDSVGSLAPTDALGVGPESMSHWQPLLEYLITVQQGVAELPKRNLKQLITPQRTKASTASAAVGGSDSIAVAKDAPAPAPAPVVQAPRHMFVGFLHPIRSTLSLPSIRTVASQIVQIRPWSGVWLLGIPFQLQFATPRDVSEMVVVSDGRWSALNEGVNGFVPSSSSTDDMTSQTELLAACQAMHGAAAGGAGIIFDSSPDAMGSNRNRSTKGAVPPPLQYLQTTARSLFTLDWALLERPELLIYFRVGKRYYPLSYFLPKANNYIPQHAAHGSDAHSSAAGSFGTAMAAVGAVVKFAASSSSSAVSASGSSSSAGSAGGKKEKRKTAKALVDYSLTPSPLPPAERPTPVTTAPAVAEAPHLDSRWFVCPSGAAFESHLHALVSSARVDSRSVELRLEALRDVEVRARIVEGWAGTGRHATSAPQATLSSEQLSADMATNKISVVELTAAMQRPRTQLPRALQSKPLSQSLLPGLFASQSDAAAASSSGQDSLHRRLLVRASLPAPDSLSNASSTAHFSLMIYVRSSDDDDDDEHSKAEEGVGAKEQDDAAASISADPLSAAASSSAVAVCGASRRPFRFALSFQLWAGANQADAPPPPPQLSARA